MKKRVLTVLLAVALLLSACGPKPATTPATAPITGIPATAGRRAATPSISGTTAP